MTRHPRAHLPLMRPRRRPKAAGVAEPFANERLFLRPRPCCPCQPSQSGAKIPLCRARFDPKTKKFFASRRAEGRIRDEDGNPVPRQVRQNASSCLEPPCAVGPVLDLGPRHHPGAVLGPKCGGHQWYRALVPFLVMYREYLLLSPRAPSLPFFFQLSLPLAKSCPCSLKPGNNSRSGTVVTVFVTDAGQGPAKMAVLAHAPSFSFASWPPRWQKVSGPRGHRLFRHPGHGPTQGSQKAWCSQR
jgi:hypothetical protein